MTKRTLALALLNVVVILSLPLLAQGPTPPSKSDFPAAMRNQHSILERIGVPKAPAAHVARTPAEKPKALVAAKAETKAKAAPAVDINTEKVASDPQPMIRELADYDDPLFIPADTEETAKAFDVRFEGPEQIEPGELQVFHFTVTNTQAVQSQAAVMQLATPAGLEFVDSTVQARVHLEQNLIEWLVQPLAPNQTVQVNFRIRGTQPGMQKQELTVLQNAKRIQNQTLESFVSNKQSVQARIVADDQSVPVGHPSQVEVTLTNLTHEMQRDLEVKVELPAGVRVVDSVLYDVEENVVTFQPIDINGNQTRRVSLTVIANEAGQSQLSAVVVSNMHTISNKENASMQFSQLATTRSKELTTQR